MQTSRKEREFCEQICLLSQSALAIWNLLYLVKIAFFLYICCITVLPFVWRIRDVQTSSVRRRAVELQLNRSRIVVVIAIKPDSLFISLLEHHNSMKKALRETQTLRARWLYSKVRTPLARHKHTNTQTGPITIHCAAS